MPEPDLTRPATATAVAEPDRTVDRASHIVDPEIDREFLVSLAKLPLIAAVIVLINWGAYQLWAALSITEGPNLAPVVVICAGMLLAAFIDGWAFRVPNWLTLSLVVAGWMIGLLHDFRVPVDGGVGGLGAALMGTFIGFALLIPMYAIGGMGAGDVKMQMGFGSLVGAFFGFEAWKVIVAAFAIGALVGGLFAVVIIAMRMQYRQNLRNFREIGTDFKVMATDGIDQGVARADSRRPQWVKLPYGVPLCVGFVGYLCYVLS